MSERSDGMRSFRSEFGFQGIVLVLLLFPQTLPWVIPVHDVLTWSWWTAATRTLSALLCPLIVWTLLDTGYLIGRDVLDLRMGPLRKRIPLDSITGVRTEGPIRGQHFGLGSALIQIDHSGGSVAVSPRKPDAFLAAIAHPPASARCP
ncbi:MAG: PH domain-containing protein [Gammaproteobacteria bacterium]|nr:PH domain-containing protein [Gammaproteobacteria bacterium]